jgi:hypothetical protein
LDFLLGFFLSYLLCDGILVKRISVLHTKGQGGIVVGKSIPTTTGTSEFGDIRVMVSAKEYICTAVPVDRYKQAFDALPNRACLSVLMYVLTFEFADPLT